MHMCFKIFQNPPKGEIASLGGASQHRINIESATVLSGNGAVSYTVIRRSPQKYFVSPPLPVYLGPPPRGKSLDCSRVMCFTSSLLRISSSMIRLSLLSQRSHQMS